MSGWYGFSHRKLKDSFNQTGSSGLHNIQGFYIYSCVLCGLFEQELVVALASLYRLSSSARILRFSIIGVCRSNVSTWCVVLRHHSLKGNTYRAISHWLNPIAKRKLYRITLWKLVLPWPVRRVQRSSFKFQSGHKTRVRREQLWRALCGISRCRDL